LEVIIQSLQASHDGGTQATSERYRSEIEELRNSCDERVSVLKRELDSERGRGQALVEQLRALEAAGFHRNSGFRNSEVVPAVTSVVAVSLSDNAVSALLGADDNGIELPNLLPNGAPIRPVVTKTAALHVSENGEKNGSGSCLSTPESQARASGSETEKECDPNGVRSSPYSIPRSKEDVEARISQLRGTLNQMSALSTPPPRTDKAA